MRVLVTAASRHGATKEIGEAIGSELAGRGMSVTVSPVEEVRTVAGCDAVVLGSAIYLGRFLKPARQFAEREAEALRAVPVWMFSSGPIGRGDKPVGAADRKQGDEIAQSIGAREHRVFDGKLDRSKLGPLERAAVRAAKSPDGDFRDWDAIRAWAAGIAETLQHQRAG